MIFIFRLAPRRVRMSRTQGALRMSADLCAQIRSGAAQRIAEILVWTWARHARSAQRLHAQPPQAHEAKVPLSRQKP
jgi:hypothetical protein